MADEVANAVNDSAVQDTATTDSAPAEEQHLEMVTEGPDLNPNDFQNETETEDKPVETDDVADTETDKPQESDKPLSPKSENRFQQLANERNAALEEAQRVKQELEQLRQREAQFANEQDLLNQVNPETGDYYSPQEIERIAFQQSRELQAQQVAEQRYSLEVQQNQLAINNEAASVVNDFPIFNPSSPDFNPDVAKQAAQLLQDNLVYDQNNQLIGANISPYKLYQTIASAYTASAVPNQIKGQRATEKMLSAADNPTSAKPVRASAKDESDMSPAEYAKAHGLEKTW